MKKTEQFGTHATAELEGDEGFQMVALFLIRALMIHGTVAMTKEQMTAAAEVGLDKLVMNFDCETQVFTAALKVE